MCKVPCARVQKERPIPHKILHGRLRKFNDELNSLRSDNYSQNESKPTGKRPLERPRCGWEDNIRMDLEEIGINAGNWVDSAQDRNYWTALVNVALNLRVS